MPLMQIHESLLLDPDALVFVQFENMDQDPTAVLKFKDGSSGTVSGAAARQLQQHLNSPEAEQRRGASRTGEAPLEPTRQSAAQSTVASVHFADGRTVTATVPVVPYIGRNKAWFHRQDESGRQYILAFVNAKGSCSLRTFDENGIFLGKQYRSGNYHDQFADLITGAVELTVSSQPNLERDCKERLPAPVLSYLRKQIS